MGRIAIIIGALMVVLGGGLYGTAVARGINGDPPQEASVVMVRALTALIPAVFGIVLIILGAIAKSGSDSTRKHTMHAAAVIGLLGIMLPAWRVIKALTADAPMDLLPVGGNVAMILISAVFLVLCIKSFIDARRRRVAEAQSASPR